MKTIAAILAATGALTLAAGAADAKTLIMALDRAGTLYNASGSGVAKVASQHSGHQKRIQERPDYPIGFGCASAGLRRL